MSLRIVALAGLIGVCAPLLGKAQTPVKPDYKLVARFMPAEMKQLVFDTGVTPHWFRKSDRFWFSFQTPAGTNYYLVDPAAKSRRPLWDNTKVAEQLSLLTNSAFDPQHMDIEHAALTAGDAGLRFSVALRKDARLPGAPPEPPPADQKAPADAPVDVYFEYTFATGRLSRPEGYKPVPHPLWAAISPDGQMVVFARGNNLYAMDAANYAKAIRNPADDSIAETELATDGVDKYSYASPLVPEMLDALRQQDKQDADNPKGMRRPSLAIHWSQDGRKFALVRSDDRKVADLWVIHSLATPRPELETYSYAMPGEQNVPIPEIQIFDRSSHQRVVVAARDLPLVDPSISLADAPETAADRERAARFGDQLKTLKLTGLGDPAGASPRWLGAGSDKLYFTSVGRDFRDADVGVINTSTGAVTTLIQESSNAWLDTRPDPYGQGGLNLHLANHGQDLIWWSERDGWARYYLYDSTGRLLHAINSGPYMAGPIVAQDDASGALYFLASGHDPKINPYDLHLCRTNLDGTGLTDLTPGDFNVAASASDDGKYFVATASRVDSPPVATLLDGQGALVTPLAHTDVSRLLAAGYKYPETFTVKAADGITDLYGVMFKPFNFDPHRKYPVIEYVYPGPQTESVPTSFNPKDPNVALAQLGFVVVDVGNRGGSPLRDKWYDSFGYGNLRDYGLADKRQAVINLADQFPFVDATKVGIWGHSGGGFMTAAAMLQYPTFYTAGWSESGNHDNNVYNKAWSEKYDGVRQQKEADGAIKFLYTIEKNSDLAANLRGHLMLTTGDMDNNVSMANTMRLANALIHADKRFEMLVFPGMRHPYTPIGDYVLVRRMDFFARWLLGASDTDPDIFLLQNEKQHTPSKKFIE